MLFNEQEVEALSLLPMVKQSFALGSVLAVTLHSGDEKPGSSGQSADFVQQLQSNGVLARSLGDTICIMTSPLTNVEECSRAVQKLRDILISESTSVV